MRAEADQFIGTSQLRREDPRLLMGRGRFVADISLPRMVEAAFVRSRHAYARLGAIDAASAMNCPGVEAVLTAQDFPRIALSFSRHPRLKLTEQPILAFDKVRFVGEPIAIVIGRDRYVAEDGLDLINVDYQALSGDVPLFDHIPDNMVFQDSQTWGEVDEAFTQAARIVSSSFRNDRQLACPLETRGCVASFDPSSGELTIWSATQVPHRLRRDLAAALGMPEGQVRVVMHDIGGGFGLKIPTHVEEVAIALASRALGRPVRWIEDRQESFISAPHSRDQQIELELALDRSLRFTALRARIHGDAGAYSFNSGTCLTEAYRAARSMLGVYKIERYSYDVSISLTNKSPIAPYRGVGQAAAQCARELLVDKAARELGVDRFELRERNIIRRDDLPYTSCAGWVLDDASFHETLVQARQRLNAAMDKIDPPPPGALRGFGISPYVEPSGSGAGAEQVSGYPGASHDTARVSVNGSGHATVVVGTPSIGQGLETTLTQVAADALGFKLEDVMVAWTDTRHAPLSLGGTRASRAAVVSSGAVARAALAVRGQILEVAAALLQARPDELATHDGMIWKARELTPRMSIKDVVSHGLLRAGLPDGLEPTFEAARFYDAEGANYSNACVIAVVTVWPSNGKVRVEHIIAAEDCGTMINPMIVEGQFVGGAMQGIGMALFERFIYDDQGQPVTTTMMDYVQPTAHDAPTFDVGHVVTPSSVTWKGIKGVGEGGVIGAVGAVAAAVGDAIAGRGVEVREIPLVPAVLWSMLHADHQKNDEVPRPSVDLLA